MAAGLRIDAPPFALMQDILEPVRLPKGGMTQAQVERAWRADRAALVAGRKRNAALIKFIEARDGRLRGVR